LKKIANVVGRAVGRDEVLRTARAQMALQHWPEIVGEALASRSRPDRYGKGTVWVAVQGSAWAQELRMSKDVILERLRAHAGDPSLFSDVRFGVRPLPQTPMAGPEPEGPEILPRDTELSIREIARRRLAKMRGEPFQPHDQGLEVDQCPKKS